MDYRGATAPVFKWLAAPLSCNPGGAVVNMLGGKLLGGTSRVNANLYTRSVPGEYNAWAAAGRVGWDWETVEPYFMKSETSLSRSDSPHRGTEGKTGKHGPISAPHSLYRAMEDTCHRRNVLQKL